MKHKTQNSAHSHPLLLHQAGNGEDHAENDAVEGGDKDPPLGGQQEIQGLGGNPPVGNGLFQHKPPHGGPVEMMKLVTNPDGCEKTAKRAAGRLNVHVGDAVGHHEDRGEKEIQRHAGGKGAEQLQSRETMIPEDIGRIINREVNPHPL